MLIKSVMLLGSRFSGFSTNALCKGLDLESHELTKPSNGTLPPHEPLSHFGEAFFDSESVSTDTSSSFPTLVAQLAVLAATPCSFLHTFLVESIFKMDPYVEVAAA